MKFFKKYWYLIVLAVITVGLGMVTFLTSQNLKQEQPVAPSVPQAVPRAVENACIKRFTLTITTPTPTGVNTPTPTPTGANTPTPTPTGVNTPTPTPTGANTPTPTPTGANTPTPTSPAGPTPTPTTPPTPQIPVSGSGPSVLGASTIAGGILLLLVGLFAF